MEHNTDVNQLEKGKKTNGFTKQINCNFEFPEHITQIDLSCRKIFKLDDNIKFPPNLVKLNISNNELTEIPISVSNLSKLESLDVSHNKITYFDDCPEFCQTIEKIDLSHNDLFRPPYWIWTRAPQNLWELNLSFNWHLTKSLNADYLKELLQNKTSIKTIKIYNCDISNLILFSTLSKTRIVEIGSDVYLQLYAANRISSIPSKGLDSCYDIEILRLSNNFIYTLESNIDIFTKLVEINLSQNYISILPEEFCNLSNLNKCILSMNHLLHLPDGIGKLSKLAELRVDSNELCALPASIVELKCLKILDLYDNCLYEVLDDIIGQVNEIDLAQNYFEEPAAAEYLENKEKLRLNIPERYNGRKKEIENPESEVSSGSLTADDEYDSIEKQVTDTVPDRASSPEDWDSDDYWVPVSSGFCMQRKSPTEPLWLSYVKKKMDEGNFCPMDAHQVSIAEKIKYEKLHNPSEWHESDGQFDDYSDDNS